MTSGRQPIARLPDFPAPARLGLLTVGRAPDIEGRPTLCALGARAQVAPNRFLEAVILPALALTIVLGAAGVAGPCPHPYFPMEAGLELTYRAGKSEFAYRVTAVTPTESGMTGDLEVRIKDRVGSTQAKCSKDGITTEVGGLEGMALQAAGVKANVLKSEGPFLPAPDQLTQGGAWKNKIALELEPRGMPAGMKIRTAFAKEATVVGEEQITVAAGTFKALKLLNKTTASSGSAGSERAIESFIWMAPDVGIIKIQTGDTVDLELMKVERPANAKKPATTKKAKAKQAG